MPELPEVETIRRDLQSKIVGKNITDVLVRDKRTVKGSVASFGKVLSRNKFIKIERRGKLLLFGLEDGKYLLVHLKMTGQLILAESGKGIPRGQPPSGKVESGRVIAGGHSFKGGQSFHLPDKHTRVVMEFSDNSKLFFNDLRVFGYMKIVTGKERDRIFNNDFGLEGDQLGRLKVEQFIKLFVNRKTRIKAFLLDQKIIAGIGNIYADEICFCTGVRPSRRVNELTHAEIKRLFKCTPKILKLAVKHRGTTFNNYVDSGGNKGNFVQFLKVYGRGGGKCRRCSGIIKKIKQGGRGTHFCPDCQK
jgi:formamidopyrimidine-DNA glycosylase